MRYRSLGTELECCRRAVVLLFLLPAAPSLAGDSGPDITPPPAVDATRYVPSFEPLPAPEAASVDPGALLELARRDVSALGPLSIGTPDAGLLVNPLPMPASPLWRVRHPAAAFGTEETIAFLGTAIESVEALHPGSPPLAIGDLSRADGGRLSRHRSHQAGRDVDLGFYYRRGEVDEFQLVRKGDLDLPRSWALVRALLTETDVERIFMDRSLMRILYNEALQEGEDAGWLDDVFGRLGGSHKGIIQHERRHKNHLHVRFFNRRAQECGRIVYPLLVETGALPPPTVKHRVRRGETLGQLASRYGAKASAIRAANGLHGSFLRAGRSYLIPIRRVPADSGPIVVPPRRLPPAEAERAAASATAASPASGATLAAR